MFTEPYNLGDLLKYEAPNLYSREEVTIALGQKLSLGTVVAHHDETGDIYPLNPTATDGTQYAIGVLFDDVDATAQAVDGVIICRDAIVCDQAVIWPTNMTVEQQKAAEAQLDLRGVLIRQGV